MVLPIPPLAIPATPRASGANPKNERESQDPESWGESRSQQSITTNSNAKSYETYNSNTQQFSEPVGFAVRFYPRRTSLPHGFQNRARTEHQYQLRIFRGRI